ncbi:MAG: flagellar motor stator protein MotA [Pseudomonadota bacterium]
MHIIIGFILVSVSVIGGYMLAKGDLRVLNQPAEFVVIGGAALGSFIVSNPGYMLKQVAGSFPVLLRGRLYSKQSYMELLALLFELFSRARKEGLMALEPHVEDPHSSDIFNKYPVVVKNEQLMEFIADYMRMIVGGNMNAFEMENLMDVELEAHHKDVEKPGHALTQMGDALPGFGIVAAILGVIVTMGYIGGTPEEIGGKVAAALVGSFLGILLSYGFVGPMGNAAGHQADEEARLLACAKMCILATLNGYSPQVSVEFGRKAIGHDVRPGFAELEEYVRGNG